MADGSSTPQGVADLIDGQTTILGGAAGDVLTKGSNNRLHLAAPGSIGVTSWSGGTTGLTPSTPTTGDVVLAGVLAGANGGTGVANAGKTITLGGNVATGGAFTMSGAYAFTGTLTGATTVTFPTTGTLATTTTPSASVVVGSTAVSGGTTTRILYDNAGTLGEYTLTGTGTVVAMQNSPSLTTPALGVATATTLAVGGATIGTDALSVTGTAKFSSTITASSTISNSGNNVQTNGLRFNDGGGNKGYLISAGTDGIFQWLTEGGGNVGVWVNIATADTIKFRNKANSADAALFAGATTLSGALTYGGVTLTNAVTGTGKMVLDTSPTLTTASLGSSTATTQSAGDNSTKLATTAYADNAAGLGAWTTFTPTITAGGGTFTSVSATGRYKIVGKTMYLQVKITVTTVGTASQYTQFTLPASAVSNGDSCMAMAETASTGFGYSMRVSAGGTTTLIQRYDAAFGLANGYVLQGGGVFEIQ